MKWLVWLLILFFVFTKAIHWYSHRYIGCMAIVTTTDGMKHIGRVANVPKEPVVKFQIVHYIAQIPISDIDKVKKYSFDDNLKVIEIPKSEIMSIQYEHDNWK